ncbi:MAG: hypothetical protein K2J39_09575 [Ruminococcus sp.]|nr:hypothetical protein [Ruminococcus sp.]
MGNKSTPVIVTVCTVLAGITTVLVNMTSVMEFFGIDMKKNKTESSVVQSAEIDTPEIIENTETIVTTDELAVMEAVITTEEVTTTQAVNALNLTELVTILDSEKIKVENPIRNYYPGFMTYDKSAGTLYYLDSPTVIKSVNIETREEQVVVDISDSEDKFTCVSVNPYDSTLYADITIHGYQNSNIYNISKDENFCYFNNTLDNLKFINESFILTDREGYSEIYKLDGLERYLHHNEFANIISTDAPIDIGLTAHLNPFLVNDCYYYVFLNRGKLCIAKTVQLIPEGCESVEVIKNSDEIHTYYVASDGLYYFDNNKNIYKYNLDATHTDDTLLHKSENSDILLVKGEDIPNTATSYISKDVPYFIAVDDNTFILFDSNDSKIKLLTK